MFPDADYIFFCRWVSVYSFFVFFLICSLQRMRLTRIDLFFILSSVLKDVIFFKWKQRKKCFQYVESAGQREGRGIKTIILFPNAEFNLVDATSVEFSDVSFVPVWFVFATRSHPSAKCPAP